jgi:hypothetical protein
VAARGASSLKKLVSVITADNRPPPGGEPLWCWCCRPATFASARIPPKTYENRRLPETFRRDAFTHGFRFLYTRGHRTASRWVISGSRLLRHFVVRQTCRYEYCEVVGLHAKAAPLQTLGINTPRQRTTPFEDETTLRHCLETCSAFGD